jgi:hypothetical protein
VYYARQLACERPATCCKIRPSGLAQPSNRA